MYAGCARNQVQLEHLPLCMFSWASRLINLRPNAFDARGLYLHCFSFSNFLFSACSKEGYRTEFLPRLSQHESKRVEMSSFQAYENERCSAQEVVTVGLLSSLPTVALLLGDMARVLRTASCRYHVWSHHSICFQMDTGGNRAWGTAWKRLCWAGWPWHWIPGHHIRDKLFQMQSPLHVFLTYLATRVSPAYLEPNYFSLLC